VFSDGRRIATEHLEIWRQAIIQTLGPIEVTVEDLRSFQAETRITEFGAIQISSYRMSPCRTRRTPRMIRQADPGLFQLILPFRGHAGITHERLHVGVGVSDLALYNTSWPWDIQVSHGGTMIEGIMVTFPYRVFPIPPDKAGPLTVFSGQKGIGALLAGFLTRLTADPGPYRPAEAARLGTIIMDLLATQLAQQLDNASLIPFQTARNALLTRIHAFIERNLAEPELTPVEIAAAHAISVRQLHRLFHDQNVTVAAWIRDRRLDRCRRDLADPLLRDRPIHAIAARWGFGDPAHFSHRFRNRYGITPSDYRNLAGQASDGPAPFTHR
jgi:AraC-like DNA-binding protein